MKNQPKTSDAARDDNADFARRIETKVRELLRRDDPPGRKFLDGTVVVRRTPCGRGLFANRSFAKNVPIGRVRGIVVDDALYSSDYCIDAGGSLSLEPGAPFGYLNHSCNPNCVFYRYSGPDDEEEGGGVAETEIKKIAQNEQDAQNKQCASVREDVSDASATSIVDECSRATCVGCPDAAICDSFAPELGKLDANLPIWRDDDAEIWVETLRAIEIGEELTIDYSWGLDRAIPCACGDPNCRGWIVDPTLLPELRARRERE